MTSDPDALLELHFGGGVYDSKTLDEPALQEIVKVIHAVTETARSLWRRRNPSRQRLPSGFDESVQLGLREIGQGRAVSRLVCALEPAQPCLFEDDLEEAVRFVHRVFEASHNGKSFPDELDDRLCMIYGELGTRLPSDCTLKFTPNGEAGEVIDAAARQRFRDRLSDTTTDVVDISGRVLAADVYRRTFQLWLDSTTRIDAKFTKEQERQIMEALRDHDSVQIRLRGQGSLRRNGEILRIDHVDRIDELGTDQRAFDTTAPGIAEMVATAFAHVPDEAWDSLPADLAERHDEYLGREAEMSP